MAIEGYRCNEGGKQNREENSEVSAERNEGGGIIIPKWFI